MQLVPGQSAPEFDTTASDGAPWSLSDHLGRFVVLYFYPKDASAGCTVQAAAVRDAWAEFDAQNAVVAGISPDSATSHEAFRADQALPQTLLMDEDHRIAELYEAWGEKHKDGRAVWGIIRSSVVIAPDGTVLAVFSPIDPADQKSLALQALSAASAR